MQEDHLEEEINQGCFSWLFCCFPLRSPHVQEELKSNPEPDEMSPENLKSAFFHLHSGFAEVHIPTNLISKYPHLARNFKQFCKKEYNGENFRFYVEVNKYNEMVRSQQEEPCPDMEKIHRSAVAIFNHFLRDDAPEWVCIEPEIVASVDARIRKLKESSGITGETFDRAQEYVAAHIAKDTLPRYREYIRKTIEDDNGLEGEEFRYVVYDFIHAVREYTASPRKAAKGFGHHRSSSNQTAIKFLSLKKMMSKHNSSSVRPGSKDSEIAKPNDSSTVSAPQEIAAST